MNDDAWLAELLQKVEVGLLSAQTAQDMIAARDHDAPLVRFAFRGRVELDVVGEVEAVDEQAAQALLLSEQGVSLLQQDGSPRLDPSSLRMQAVAATRARRRGLLRR